MSLSHPTPAPPNALAHSFDEDLRNVMPWGRSHWSHTDLTRLKKGRISAQVSGWPDGLPRLGIIIIAPNSKSS